jgi:hypothetical protein
MGLGGCCNTSENTWFLQVPTTKWDVIVNIDDISGMNKLG